MYYSTLIFIFGGISWDGLEHTYVLIHLIFIFGGVWGVDFKKFFMLAHARHDRSVIFLQFEH